MKILFIGARLFDDVALYTAKNSITSILTESNHQSPNLDLANSHYLVSRGMKEPMRIAIEEDVDGVVPLIGIDGPLVEVAEMKEKLEENHGIPVAASGISAATICGNKQKTKEFFVKNRIKTPDFFKITHNNNKISPTIDPNQLPLVLKQSQGQGGSGIKIATTPLDIEEYFEKFDSAFAEQFIKGFEVSIEILRWNGESVPLVPVCKGETTIEGTHPLKKIKKAPLNIDNVENIINNQKIREIAVKIAETLNLEGCADIDMIFDPETGQNNVIEINTRPSGTRYITAAATGVNILQELINMASGQWNAQMLKNNIKDYSAIEIPVGSYPSNKNNYKYREFSEANHWIIHGPKNYERITIRGNTNKEVIKTAEKLGVLNK